MLAPAEVPGGVHAQHRRRGGVLQAAPLLNHWQGRHQPRGLAQEPKESIQYQRGQFQFKVRGTADPVRPSLTKAQSHISLIFQIPFSSNEHLTATVAVCNGNNGGGGVGGGGGSARTSATCSLASSRESSTSNPGSIPYRVLMLGGAAVGKSSLVSQFMTSEYLHAYDTSIGK